MIAVDLQGHGRTALGDRPFSLQSMGADMAAVLDKGMRAVSTEISPETGAGGFILPNDRVDVILSRRDREAEKQGAAETHTSDTILSNIRVLAIDRFVAGCHAFAGTGPIAAGIHADVADLPIGARPFEIGAGVRTVARPELAGVAALAARARGFGRRCCRG